MSNRAQKVDRQYFIEHPGAESYYRPPLLGEWECLELPADARVAVYWISKHCRIRVLENATTEARLATPIIDVEEEPKPVKMAA